MIVVSNVLAEKLRAAEIRWVETLKKLMRSVPANEFETWILSLDLGVNSRGELQLLAPFSVFCSYVIKNFGEAIRKAAGEKISIGVVSLDSDITVSDGSWRKVLKSSSGAPVGVCREVLAAVPPHQSVDGEVLDFDLRVKILKAKSTEAGLALDDRVIEREVRQMHGSVREIEGYIRHMVLIRDSRERLDNVVDDTALFDTVELANGKRVSLDAVIDVVAFAFGLTRTELLSSDRSRRVAWPRHVAAYIGRTLTGASLTELGFALGGINHTTVLRAVRSIKKKADRDHPFAERVHQVEQLLKDRIAA